MIYKKYSGNDVSYKIINYDDDPYTRIEDKAFLSCKNIVEIEIPSTVTEIGNWAFSHMKSLRRLIIPANTFAIGKEIFLDCDNLNEIIIYDDESENEGLGKLFAASQIVMKCPSLFNPCMAAGRNTHREWIRNFDDELIRFIYMPDEHGFQSVLIGWFDDEGEDVQLTRYMKRQQFRKAELILLRLIYDMYLDETDRKKITDYFSAHLKGGKKASEHISSWEYLKENVLHNFDIVKALDANGLLDGQLMEELIEFFNENDGDPEILSFLISNKTIGTADDVFNDFDL